MPGTIHELTEPRTEPAHPVPSRMPPDPVGTCRIHNRFTAIPFLMDGSPDWEHRLSGDEVAVTGEAVEVHLEATGDVQPGAMLLVFQERPGLHHCMALEGTRSRRDDESHISMEGRSGGLAAPLLEARNLVPVFDRQNLEFRLPLPEGVLARWAEIGVLEPCVVDLVIICPACEGLPTFRPGCRRCGSARLVSDRLIHHFACAHVGPVETFELEDGLVCPKCRVRNLVVGVDYEYLQGSCACLECHWTDACPEQVAQCLGCGLRFPGHQAHQKVLRGYHVQRLDPRALALPV